MVRQTILPASNQSFSRKKKGNSTQEKREVEGRRTRVHIFPCKIYNHFLYKPSFTPFHSTSSINFAFHLPKFHLIFVLNELPTSASDHWLTNNNKKVTIGLQTSNVASFNMYSIKYQDITHFLLTHSLIFN